VMRGYGQVRWQRARAGALSRARHRCQTCGSTTALRVHHLDGQGMTGPRATDPTNLRVLCARCHARRHVPSPYDLDATAVVIPNYRRE
jgi:5-methylcytosine-specific restriction endonuclease McrA